MVVLSAGPVVDFLSDDVVSFGALSGCTGLRCNVVALRGCYVCLVFSFVCLVW